MVVVPPAPRTPANGSAGQGGEQGVSQQNDASATATATNSQQPSSDDGNSAGVANGGSQNAQSGASASQSGAGNSSTVDVSTAGGQQGGGPTDVPSVSQSNDSTATATATNNGGSDDASATAVATSSQSGVDNQAASMVTGTPADIGNVSQTNTATAGATASSDGDGSAASTSNASQSDATNGHVVIRVDAPGTNGDVAQSNVATATATGGGGATATQTGAGNENISARVFSPGDNGAVTQKNAVNAETDTSQLDAWNRNISVRLFSPGADGPVSQVNTVNGAASSDDLATAWQAAGDDPDVPVIVAAATSHGNSDNISVIVGAGFIGTVPDSWMWTWQWSKPNAADDSNQHGSSSHDTDTSGPTWDWIWKDLSDLGIENVSQGQAGNGKDNGNGNDNGNGKNNAAEAGSSADQASGVASGSAAPATGTFTWVWRWTKSDDANWVWDWSVTAPCDCSWSWDWDWNWGPSEGDTAPSASSTPALGSAATEASGATALIQSDGQQTLVLTQVNAATAEASASNSSTVVQGAYGDEPSHSDQRAATVQTAVAEAETAQALAANTATIADPDVSGVVQANVADAGADASNDSTVEQLIGTVNDGSGMQAVAQGAQAVQQGSASAAAAQSDAGNSLRAISQPQPGSDTPITVTQANGVAATSEVANLSETTQLALQGQDGATDSVQTALQLGFVDQSATTTASAGQALAGNYLSLTAPRPQVDEPADQFSVQQLNVGEADSIGANSSYLEQNVVQLQSNSTGSSEDATHAAIVSQTTQSTTEVEQTNVSNGADQDSFDSAGVSNGDYYQHNAAVATAASANASGTAQASEQEQTGTVGATSEADNEAVVVQENTASASAYQHGVENRGPFEDGVSESIATSNAVAYNVSVVDQAIEQSEIVGDTLESPTGGGPGGGGNPGGGNPGGNSGGGAGGPSGHNGSPATGSGSTGSGSTGTGSTGSGSGAGGTPVGTPGAGGNNGTTGQPSEAPAAGSDTDASDTAGSTNGDVAVAGQPGWGNETSGTAVGGTRSVVFIDSGSDASGNSTLLLLLTTQNAAGTTAFGGPLEGLLAFSSSSDVPASASAPEDSGNGLGGAVGSSGGVAAGRAPGFSGSASTPALEGFPVPPDDGGVVVPSPVLQPPGAVVAVLDSPG